MSANLTGAAEVGGGRKVEVEVDGPGRKPAANMGGVGLEVEVDSMVLAVEVDGVGLEVEFDGVGLAVVSGPGINAVSVLDMSGINAASVLDMSGKKVEVANTSSSPATAISASENTTFSSLSVVWLGRNDLLLHWEHARCAETSLRVFNCCSLSPGRGEN